MALLQFFCTLVFPAKYCNLLSSFMIRHINIGDISFSFYVTITAQNQLHSVFPIGATASTFNLFFIHVFMHKSIKFGIFVFFSEIYWKLWVRLWLAREEIQGVWRWRIVMSILLIQFEWTDWLYKKFFNVTP